MDGGGGGECGDGNSSGSGLAVISHCGSEAVLVRRVLDVPDPAVGVSNGVGARHDVTVSALLPLLGVARHGVVDRVSVVVPRHGSGTRHRDGLLEDGANDRRLRDGGVNHGADHGRVMDEGRVAVVDGDGGAVKGDGHRGSGGGSDEGVSGSLVGDGGVGVRHGGGGRHGPHLLHMLHVVCHRLGGVGDRVHDGVRDGANGGGSLVSVDGGRRVGGVGGRHGDRGGNGADHGSGASVVVMDECGRDGRDGRDGGRDGIHSLQDWTADASDAGEDLRCGDREGGREEEDEEKGLKRSTCLVGSALRLRDSFEPATYNLGHFVEARRSRFRSNGELDGTDVILWVNLRIYTLCRRSTVARVAGRPAAQIEPRMPHLLFQIFFMSRMTRPSHIALSHRARRASDRRRNFGGNGGNREPWVSHVASAAGRTDRQTLVRASPQPPPHLRPRPSVRPSPVLREPRL